jgi:putative transposase
MKFDPQKHHRHSIRLKKYDYTQAGGYFITIVTFQREHVFGEIQNSEMQLNKFGLVAKQQWEKLPKRFQNIELGEYVIMPNHMHGIIQILGASRTGTAKDSRDQDDSPTRRARTEHHAPTEQFGQPVPGSIPTIIRSYKSAVAYRINLMRGIKGIPVWHGNYYEHVIRSHEDWDRIHRYIESNPARWAEDEENL